MLETKASIPLVDRVAAVSQLRFSGSSHISLPCCNLEEFKLFYSQVMGRERVHLMWDWLERCGVPS
ncbi:MAG: hypothetical protein ACM3SP_11095 [Chloroflexota bacterium]